MIFPQGFLGKPMTPRQTSVKKYLFPIMVLTSVVTCSWSIPIQGTVRTDIVSTDRSEVQQHPHRHRHHNRSTHHHEHQKCPLGLEGLLRIGSNCCRNGGVPILGRCACPKNFGGDYCQFRKRSCFDIPHGGVFIQKCSVCKCQYGIIACVPRAFKHCKWDEAYAADDGRMKTYDLRLKEQKELVLKEYPNILTPVAASSGHPKKQPSSQILTFLLTVLYLLQTNILLSWS